jgi:predicted tellurium resistance membrane protein TerC
MEWLSDPNVWISFFTLTALEIVLGIDNVIFISILAGKLPESERSRARSIGLALALITRVLLLLSITWIMRLESDLFRMMGQGISGRDLILLVGGLFLLFKSVREIHEKLEGDEGHSAPAARYSFGSIIAQILVLDVVFSLDSVITAVGMADVVGVMIAAVIVAVVFMLLFAGPVSSFVEKHPTVKILALAFLVLIGTNLIVEAFEVHIPKGYTYFAMAFAVGVEMINLRIRHRAAPVKLRSPYADEPEAEP